ncbi:hypothetical protein ATK78_1726 [Pedobacter metabolipauper]|uniref:Uncharacterized protein n=1 Tax=Pedobacter metabolipauper TaxID=425513 RepID=A0A4R6SUY0_9SPHI|nr:hypothetical protein ATK78_1726 [Pedobacter metabolipauper]
MKKVAMEMNLLDQRDVISDEQQELTDQKRIK